MTGTTTNEGYPYPLVSDFADVQDAYRLAAAVDSGLRGIQSAFRGAIARPSFIARQSANASGFLSGEQVLALDTVEWDNTAGMVAGASSWVQPVSQGPTWWMFGLDIVVAVISGTPVVGDLNLGKIEIDTTDQVSGLTTAIKYYQRQDETNTGGERINVVAFASIYRARVVGSLVLNGSTQKAVGAGSRLWGLQLGPVV